MKPSLTSRLQTKLKPSIKKTRSKTGRYWLYFFVLSMVITAQRWLCSMPVDTWWSRELAFSERRPRQLEEGQELQCGSRKSIQTNV